MIPEKTQSRSYTNLCVWKDRYDQGKQDMEETGVFLRGEIFCKECDGRDKGCMHYFPMEEAKESAR